MEIKKLSDIDYSASNVITFNATVIDVISEGDGDKRPFKVNLKLEESGELVQVSSWKFENLETIKQLVKTDEVYIFEGQAGNFGSFGPQIRLGNIRNSGIRSTKKIIKTLNIEELKSELQSILNTYYQRSDTYYKLIKKLVLDNDNFWKWPAATRVHHAYQGGLAKHSINVLKNAILIWKNYQGSNLDIKLLVAGAILHDIGKLTEYNIDGTRTIYGNLIPHPVSGYDILMRSAVDIGILDPSKDKSIVMLSHIILSHHGKLEYGASVTPYIAEAVIVNRADNLDAAYESMDAALSNVETNTETSRLMALDGLSIFKWK